MGGAEPVDVRLDCGGVGARYVGIEPVSQRLAVAKAEAGRGDLPPERRRRHRRLARQAHRVGLVNGVARADSGTPNGLVR
jgi:hypothetical protein